MPPDNPAINPAPQDLVSDEQLLARFHQGDRAALGTLASRYETPLLGLAAGLVDGRVDLAKDAVQEAWLRVIRYGKTFRADCTLRTWLYRIVINRCRDLRQRPATHTATPNGTLHHPDTQSAVEPPQDTLTRESTNDQLRAALNTLSPQARLLLLLCYHRGLNHPQAAELLDIPLGTLKSRLSAALAELRNHMQAPDHPRSPAALEGTR